MGWVLRKSFQSFLAVHMFHVQSVHEIGCPAGHHCVPQLQQDAQQHAGLGHGVGKGEYDLANLSQNTLTYDTLTVMSVAILSAKCPCIKWAQVHSCLQASYQAKADSPSNPAAQARLSW